MNIIALGAIPYLCGVTGEDPEADALIELCKQHDFNDRLIFKTPSRRTTTKTRILGNRQQILRIDKEDRHPIDRKTEDEILENLLPHINHFQVIIFEDYDKGMITPRLISEITKAAIAAERPVVVDPKFRNFFHYNNCTVFKPNLKELNDALHLRLDNKDISGIVKAVGDLREKMPHRQTLITLSENGVLVVNENLEPTHIPAHFRQVTDVSGAGDTVVSVIAVCLAAGYDLVKASTIANLAGGLVCEKVGVVPVELERFAAEVVEHGYVG